MEIKYKPFINWEKRSRTWDVYTKINGAWVLQMKFINKDEAETFLIEYERSFSKMNQKDLLLKAYRLAKNSNDHSTRLGALLVDDTDNVLMTGVNSMPESLVNNLKNHARPRKYKITEHAERAVIYNAAKIGLSTNCLIMVTPLIACSDCARAIVLSGIKKVITHKQAFDRLPDRWIEEMAIGLEIIENGGIECISFNGEIGGVTNLLFGETWRP